MMLAFAFALAAAAPLPPGTLVAGVSPAAEGAESAHTDVTAFLPDGTSRVLFTEAHAPGFVPEGAIDGARAVLAVQQAGAEGASVVVIDLATGARTVVGQRAVRTHAPRLEGDVVTWVRAAESPLRSTFDVVTARVDGVGEEVRASVDGAWLTPIAGVARYLHITSDGDNRVLALAGTSLDVTRVLGKGRYRVPALAGARMLVERGLPAGRAEIVDERGVVVRTGLAGMEPLAARDASTAAASAAHFTAEASAAHFTAEASAAHFVMGAGTKRAALVVIEGKRERTLDLGRAGIATPRAAAFIDGALVAAAWLDRGRTLPGELVLVDARGPRVIVSGGAHVEVYGIIGDIGDVGDVGDVGVVGDNDVLGDVDANAGAR